MAKNYINQEVLLYPEKEEVDYFLSVEKGSYCIKESSCSSNESAIICEMSNKSDFSEEMMLSVMMRIVDLLNKHGDNESLHNKDKLSEVAKKMNDQWEGIRSGKIPKK